MGGEEGALKRRRSNDKAESGGSGKEQVVGAGSQRSDVKTVSGFTQTSFGCGNKFA